MINRILVALLGVVFGLFLLSDIAMAGGDPKAGAATYTAKCKMCHGADGKGNLSMKVPTFNQAKSDADLKKAITEGIKPRMPAFGGKLTPSEIDNVVAHIKTLK